MNAADKEWYVLWRASASTNPSIIRGRRAAWDAFRVTTGPLPPSIIEMARKHLEDAGPAPVGEVAWYRFAALYRADDPTGV